jgi:GAF domain-containing protein
VDSSVVGADRAAERAPGVVLDRPYSTDLAGVTGQVARALGRVATFASILDARPFLRSEVGLPLAMVTAGETPMLDSLAMLVAGNDGPLVVGDVGVDASGRTVEVMERLGSRACLAVPLRDGRGGAVGALCAIADAPRGWTAEEIDLMTAFGEVAGEAVGERLGPGDLESPPAPTTEVNEAFLRTDSYGEAVLGALDALRGRLGWDVAGAWVLTPDGELLRCAGYSHGEAPGLAAFTDLCLGIGLGPNPDPVLSARELEETILCPDQLPSEQDFPRLVLARSAGFAGGAWAPLHSGPVSIGALELLNLEPRPLDRRDAALLEEVGTRLGGLIALRLQEQGQDTPWIHDRPKEPDRLFRGLPQAGDW